MSSSSWRAPVVAHVVESSDGGVATIVAMLIEAQKNDPAFETIHLLADQNTKDKRLLKSPDVLHEYRSSRSPLRVPGVCRELRERLKAIGPDVVVLHSTFPGFWGRLIGGNWSTVYCAHGWAFNRDAAGLSKFVYGIIENALSHRSQSIVSISQDEYRTAQKFGVRTEKHQVIYHGVEPTNPASTPILPSKSSVLDLAFVGRFERPKGIDILYQIFDDPRLDKINVWIVGGDVRGSNEYRLPSRPNLRQLGWLDRAQVDNVLRQVDALIAPSRWEAFGLAAVEAMRNSKAVIASRVGGLAELVEDGVNGRFLDINDVPGCRELLLGLTREKLSALGQAGFKRFETRYAWSTCYSKWRTLILAAAGNEQAEVQSPIVLSDDGSRLARPH